jgi:hypothetical protein
MFYESVVLVQDGSVPWPYLSRPASSDSVLALGCGALRSLFSFANSVGFCLAPLDPSLAMLRTRVGREILVCSASPPLQINIA